MNQGQLAVSLGLLAMTVSYWVLAQESSNPGGFTILHRSEFPDAPGIEVVMGVLDRSQKTISSKHYHPYGEFGFVIDGAVTIETADQGTMTLEAGSSFHQAPGKWHVVSTPDTGARTVLFRIVKKGDPMIVEVD